MTPLVRRRGRLFVVLGASLSRDETARLRDELSAHLAAPEPPAPDDEEPTRRDTPIAIAAVRDTEPAPRRSTSSGKLSAVVEGIFRDAKDGKVKPDDDPA